MASLQVRDFPEPLYRKLAERAEREHRSIAQQAIVLLAETLNFKDAPDERRAQVFERLAEIERAMEKYPRLDPEALVREDRDR